jgi:hypothetical protein
VNLTVHVPIYNLSPSFPSVRHESNVKDCCCIRSPRTDVGSLERVRLGRWSILTVLRLVLGLEALRSIQKLHVNCWAYGRPR